MGGELAAFSHSNPLVAKWEAVCAAARRNDEVRAILPRKWTRGRLKSLKTIDDYLDGDWDPLVDAVEVATNWGASAPISVSLSKLTERDCDRLEDLISGRWTSLDKSGKVKALKERYWQLHNIGNSTQADQEMRSIRKQLERLGELPADTTKNRADETKLERELRYRDSEDLIDWKAIREGRPGVRDL